MCRRVDLQNLHCCIAAGLSMMPLMHNWGRLVAGCALMLYVFVCFTSNSAFQACSTKPLPGDLTCSLFLFHCRACFGAGGRGKLG